MSERVRPGASSRRKDGCHVVLSWQRNDLQEWSAPWFIAACVRACVLLHRRVNAGARGSRRGWPTGLRSGTWSPTWSRFPTSPAAGGRGGGNASHPVTGNVTGNDLAERTTVVVRIQSVNGITVCKRWILSSTVYWVNSLKKAAERWVAVRVVLKLFHTPRRVAVIRTTAGKTSNERGASKHFTGLQRALEEGRIPRGSNDRRVIPDAADSTELSWTEMARIGNQGHRAPERRRISPNS